MASAIIHIAVGKKIGDLLGKTSKEFLLGTIAPDISKVVGGNRNLSHFIDYESSKVPNINRFLAKYKDSIDKDFEFGYLIHLYTDKYWSERFLANLKLDDKIKLLDGTIIAYPIEKIVDLIYNDYSNINVSTIEDHNLDLSIFYESCDYPKTVIEEIPQNLDSLIKEMGIIIENSKRGKTYLFD